MKAPGAIALFVALAGVMLALGTRAQPGVATTPVPAGDVLPFRLLYGNPGPATPNETACFVWSEGGRLHIRVTSDGAPHEIAGALEVTPGGVLKDVSIEAPGIRIQQRRPSLLRFDLRTDEPTEELSVVLAGDVETLRIDLRVDGREQPAALRIGERRERPKGLPADLALTGARASWIERFGFN